jgi:predicted XRE-type DNA-binding protein
MTMSKRSAVEKVYTGRSVFEDLGYSPQAARPLMDAVEEQVRRRNALKQVLVDELNREIEARHLNLTDAATMLLISRPRLSDISHAKFEKFSIDSALDLLHRLGKSIEFVFSDMNRAKVVQTTRAGRGKGAKTESASQTQKKTRRESNVIA